MLNITNDGVFSYMGAFPDSEEHKYYDIGLMIHFLDHLQRCGFTHVSLIDFDDNGLPFTLMPFWNGSCEKEAVMGLYISSSVVVGVSNG